MDLFQSVKNAVKLRELDTDNLTFKLFYKVTFGICLLGSVLCAATSYIGTPISCEHQASLAQQYCWLHGSYSIPEKFRSDLRFGCKRDEKLTDEDTTTAYYLWVVFILSISAICFAIPRQIWKIFESGIIDNFGNQAKSSFIMANKEKVQDLAVEYVKNFEAVRYYTARYFRGFVFCEILNTLVLILVFHFTNTFLGREFSTYGSDVVSYYSQELDTRGLTTNPMCNLFPTTVSCDFRFVGPNSQVQTLNGICILSQNIINEKIFLILWFWYVFMFVVSGCSIVLRICTLAIPALRHFLLSEKIGGNRRNAKVITQCVMRNCTIGDWFLLCQIGKNCNPYFFQEFLTSYSETLSDAKDDAFLLKVDNRVD